MFDYLDGANVTLMVTLVDGGVPVVPTVGSLTYTVRDQEGVAIPALTDVPVTTGPTTFNISVVIPAVNNAVAVGRRFEKRTVTFDFLMNGVSKQQITTYRLTAYLNHSVTPGQIRGFVGVQQHELPDSEIDLMIAFMKVEKEVGLEELGIALASGTTVELAANEMIRMQAVLDVLPSLKQRIAQTETNGLKGFSRPVIRDFSDVERQAQGRYAEALQETTGRTGVDLPLAALTQDTDPITG
ncbi:hypothetical protein [Mesorhizobium sp. STM 4661]|uniref:hypothetical protein n=1 Tax=Mesorhizobium sp. STM 4661 TaxID=1297570 RepID=UPI0002BD95B1|nr:hypothetical protein [Mesorhizobium sp. STM 4661]CCV12940.1 hypothetical protein MESS4_510107 [Mesorhizobium sp. STM 4661]